MDEVLDDQMQQTKKSAVKITKEKAIYNFDNATKEELAAKVEKFLLGQGYKLEEGDVFNGKYGKGNKTLRILFGAFVKRFTWAVKVASNSELTQLVLSKNEKGYWGGAIGVHQVNKEYERLTNVIRDFHSRHHKQE